MIYPRPHPLKFVCLALCAGLLCSLPPTLVAGEVAAPATVDRTGHIEHRLITECSGLESSPAQPDLLWAINDGNNGPYLYALAHNGRHRGRFRIEGATNRDWEGLDSFRWKDDSYLLIGDFGDNRQVHATHRLYIVQEPRMDPAKEPQNGTLPIVRRIDYRYPDGGHDTEGVAVDLLQKKILLVTKRDDPPLLFEIPLFPPSAAVPVTAKRVGGLNHFEKPTAKDKTYPYGEFRSHPTALDISQDSQKLLLLTYKHAYLLTRRPDQNWADAVKQKPRLIPLPLPEETFDLRQREAICFTNASHPTQFIVTSEGLHAGIYHVAVLPKQEAPPTP